MSAAPNDTEVWDRVLTGDGDSFGVLFDRHRDRVFRHIRRIADDQVEAEDLTAVVFLELWRRRADARVVDASLLPWLLATATNVTANANRARRRYRRFLSRLPPPESLPDPAAGRDVAIDSERGARRLASAIRELSNVDRQLIALTALEGLSLTEASEAVGISYGAAKTRLSRARARLGSVHRQSLELE